MVVRLLASRSRHLGRDDCAEFASRSVSGAVVSSVVLMPARPSNRTSGARAPRASRSSPPSRCRPVARGPTRPRQRFAASARDPRRQQPGVLLVGREDGREHRLHVLHQRVGPRPLTVVQRPVHVRPAPRRALTASFSPLSRSSTSGVRPARRADLRAGSTKSLPCCSVTPATSRTGRAAASTARSLPRVRHGRLSIRARHASSLGGSRKLGVEPSHAR